MYTLRLCGPEDVLTIADFATEFAEVSYNYIPTDVAKILETAQYFLSDEAKTERIVIGLEKDGELVGAVAGTAQASFFNPNKVAIEVMWWVQPEHRNRHTLKLIEAFEFWAKQVGCIAIHLSNVQGPVMDRITKLYHRRGYQLLEQAFVKAI